MLLIGLMANAGTGKDTAADHLVRKHGFVKMSLADEIKRTAKRWWDFSDEQLWGPSHMRNAPDKRYPRGTITVPGHDGNGTPVLEVETEYLSPRFALQVLGTEGGRTCYSNTWVDIIRRNAREVLSGRASYDTKDGLTYHLEPLPLAERPAGVVIPDCRFRNEMEAVRDESGYRLDIDGPTIEGVMVRLVRPGIQKLTAGVQGHASEAEQLSIPDREFDYVLRVEEGIENFHHQVDVLVADIQARRIVRDAVNGATK
jgi:hypothetical protein